MKAFLRKRAFLYSMTLLVFFPYCLYAQRNTQYGQINNQNTLSPRFFITKGEANNFPLALTDIKVNVVGMIADVELRQVYVNNGNDPIEAVYVFPASTKAAVYGMKMQIADRIITAIVKEKQQARVDYEKAKSDGKSASLLEELAPNVFRMNVANILKGDSINVTIKYTEMLVPEDNIYQFVYPAVVGPRYVTAGSNVELINALNVQTDSRIMPGKLQFNAKISTPVPLKSLKSPSHKMDIITKDNKTGRIVQLGRNNSLTTMTLSPKDELSGARDIVFEYILAGPKIESGLLLHEGKDENYFMLMVQPPTDIVIKELMPREFIFILDVSGSMNGYPLETAKNMMNELLQTMRPIDKINVMMFSGGQSVLSSESLSATDETKMKVRDFLNTGYGGGGTELLPALKKAFEMNTDGKLSRTFVILTDGYVTVEREAFDLIRTQLNKANVYSFGIGTSVNRWLIEGMARAGKGSPFIVMNPNEAKKAADKFISYIQSPVLSHINVDYGDLDVYDLDMPSIPDVTGKRPIVVYGKWKGKKTGTVTLKGDAADGALTFSSSVEAAPSIPEHSALKYLWAKNKIIMLDDEQQTHSIAQAGKPLDYKKEITDLGLKYNLLTKYTSFIAIDENIRVKKQSIDTSISSSNQIKVDGLDVGDQFNSGLIGTGTRASESVSNFAVEEAKVQPGAFGAEYGNALGGVANTPVKKSTTESETETKDAKAKKEEEKDSEDISTKPVQSTKSGGGFLSGLFSSNSRYNQDELDDALNPKKAPPRLYVGIAFFGTGTWLHNEELITPFDNKIISLSDRRARFGYAVGLDFEYLLGDTKNANSSIIASILFNKTNSENSGTASALLQNGIGLVNFVSHTKTNNVQLQLLYRWNFPGTFLSLMGGLSSSLMLSSSREMSVHSADSILFMKGNQQVLRPSGTVLYSGEVPNVQSFQTGLVFGVGYEILLKRFILVPQIRAQYNLTKLSNDERLFSIQAGVSLRIVL